MPFYYKLKSETRDEKRRIARRLLALREALAEIPEKKVRDNLLLATWNIRELESSKGGDRLLESYFYIAEILSRFDLVAIQEVRRDLAPLETLRQILGPSSYNYIVTDVTEGKSGNEERVAYFFDTRKVFFQRVAGEIVLPADKLVGGEAQFARSPFMVAFQARWLKFNLCSVHIYYGEDTGKKLERRRAEIEAIAKFLAERQEREGESFILLGDFNILGTDHPTFEALANQGFTVPEEILGKKTNVAGSKPYDQIAFRLVKRQLEMGDSEPNAGVFRFFDTVFRNEDFDVYKKHLKTKTLNGYKTWRTYQMSDHLPLWVELKVDFSDEYLRALAK